MRKQLPVFIIYLAMGLPAIAQKPVADSLSIEFTGSRWLYPSFIPGRILFLDGTVAKALLNYNLEYGEMEFTGTKNDTMAVADEATIRSVAIGTDTFYYDQKMCLRSIGGSSKTKLAKHTVAKLVNTKRTGAYGTSTEAPGVTYYSTITPNTETIHLKNPGDEIYRQVNTYYIGDEYNHFMLLTKKNLMKKYSSNKNELSNYIDSNHIDFNREADIKKLGAYLQGIDG